MAKEKKNVTEVIENVEVAPVEETDTVDTELVPVTGIVVGCSKLNIRKKPKIDKDGKNVVTVVDVKTKLNIDLSKSTDDWYNVVTLSGDCGYCMKQYVKIEK